MLARAENPLTDTVRDNAPAVAGFTVAAAYAGVVFYGMSHWSFNVWGAFIVGPLLLGVSIPILRRLARKDPDPRLFRLLMAALVLKLLAAIPRWAMAFVLYGGTADASRYHRIGTTLGEAYRHLSFPGSPSPVPGTGFVDILTGGIYAITGPTLMGGYLVFSWLGFWGLCCFYRAAVVAVPGVDRRRYAILVLFLPSMLFWPSGIGKEAWMTLGLGLAALGAARLFTRQRGGFLLLGLGLAGAGAVRPHMAAILFVAVFAGYLLRRSGTRSVLGPLSKLVGIVLLVGIGLLVIQQTKDFFGISSVDSGSVQGVLDNTERRTSGGGSSFAASPARSIANLPDAAVSVLFRPFPWEAHNAQALLAAAEGLLLGLLLVRSVPRLSGIVRRLTEPYVLMSLVYVAEFVYAFSTFGNFGIIARERVQVLPFVVLLLCMPMPANTVPSKTLPSPKRPNELLLRSASDTSKGPR